MSRCILNTNETRKATGFGGISTHAKTETRREREGGKQGTRDRGRGRERETLSIR